MEPDGREFHTSLTKRKINFACDDRLNASTCVPPRCKTTRITYRTTTEV
jgi:hypothetical protein